ncbi:hypothetical protein JYJ95_03760 [Corallococcus exiguus]|uniref:hypothetical protein n=1 Tax=Corallococcus exiguus TaxID=83462 RepID=UPI001A8CDC1A|nr:hypothetical protein [Corallococcus exiguus]MBN8465612.1 hypothetical protein [Corallococcus exiguus]
MPRSPPALPLLLVLLTATFARAEDAPPKRHGPWVGVMASTSSRFNVGYRETYDMQDEIESTVGLGLRAGYDFLKFAGIWAEYAEEIHSGSFSAGLRLTTPTETVRAGLTGGLRFLGSEPTLPFFTAGLMGEVRPWRHLGFSLEVSKAWPLQSEVTWHATETNSGYTLLLDEGPSRVLLGLSWYF